MDDDDEEGVVSLERMVGIIGEIQKIMHTIITRIIQTLNLPTAAVLTKRTMPMVNPICGRTRTTTEATRGMGVMVPTTVGKLAVTTLSISCSGNLSGILKGATAMEDKTGHDAVSNQQKRHHILINN